MTRSFPLAKPEPRWSLGFVLAVPFGIALLWITGAIAVFASHVGECFDAMGGCRAAWETRATQGNVLIAIIAGLTILAAVAVALGRRKAPLALLSASVATLVLAGAPHPIYVDWLPRYLYVLAPGVVILAIASAGQVLDWTRWHRRGRAALESSPKQNEPEAGGPTA